MQSRYPGIRSFEVEESALFFGRKQETKALYDLIKVKRFLVLFAKSGIGKTSLLNAGVIPLLTKSGYYPIKVRFQQTDIAPTAMLIQSIERHIQQQGLTDRVKELLQRMAIQPQKPSLWEYLKACSFFEQQDAAAIPLLIFDQFEEFFLHSEAQQKPFIDGIADLMFERVPEQVQEAIRAVPRRERTAAHLEWATPLAWKIVFAIRSDRLSLLDHLSRHIPIILDHRYQLLPLDKEQAREAVVAPAALTGDHFDTAPFSYTPEALDTILDNLSNEKGEIESFQLQIICQDLEKQIHSRQASQVTPDYIGGRTGIQELLNGYYERSIGALPPQTQLSVRRLIEEGLIVEGARVSVAESVVLSRYHISPDLLAQVLETRLIRAENTHLGKAYEVAHDTLVAPILESYRMRAIKEEQGRMAAARRRARRVLMAVGAVALLVSAGFVWAIIANSAAQREIARNARLINGMYFYKDTFALSVIRDTTEALQYGFMDKQGAVRIAYQFEEAQPFDDYGYARVKKAGILYLVDTGGKLYRLAETLAAITPETQAISLKEQLLDEVPASIFEQADLRVLYLRGNQLKKLPPQMNRLKRLQTLDVSYNEMTEMPTNLSEMSNLQVLDVAYNQLPPHTDWAKEMPQLKMVNTRNNTPSKSKNSGDDINKTIDKVVNKLDSAVNSKKVKQFFKDLRGR